MTNDPRYFEEAGFFKFPSIFQWRNTQARIYEEGTRHDSACKYTVQYIQRALSTTSPTIFDFLQGKCVKKRPSSPHHPPPTKKITDYFLLGIIIPASGLKFPQNQ